MPEPNCVWWNMWNLVWQFNLLCAWIKIPTIMLETLLSLRFISMLRGCHFLRVQADIFGLYFARSIWNHPDLFHWQLRPSLSKNGTRFEHFWMLQRGNECVNSFCLSLLNAPFLCLHVGCLARGPPSCPLLSGALQADSSAHTQAAADHPHIHQHTPPAGGRTDKRHTHTVLNTRTP